jgi:5-methylcytosine-specific restriction endonuclease McrA
VKHSVHFKDVPANCYAASVLLHKVYKQMERKAWNKARTSFLDAELKKHGVLTCYYCNRTNLKRKGGKQQEKATVDHVHATSEGGDLTNHDNFVVSCEGCNRKKSNSTQEEFLSSKYLQTKRKTK